MAGKASLSVRRGPPLDLERPIDWSVNQFTGCRSGKCHIPLLPIARAIWVAFAAVRRPSRLENAIDWLRFDLPGVLGRPGRFALGALLLAAIVALLVVINPFGGGGGGETREVTIAVS